MNATQSGPFTAILDDPRAALNLARSLVAGGRIAEGVAIFRQQLSMLPKEGTDWTDHAVGLAATLCLMAQSQPHDALALVQLNEARDLVELALRSIDPTTSPMPWAIARANMAAIRLSRSALTGNPGEVMAAHLALDGTEAVFAAEGDQAGIDWVQALRDQTIEARERRNYPR